MPYKGQSQVAFKTGRESSCLVFVLVDDPEEKSDTLIYIVVLLHLDTHTTHIHTTHKLICLHGLLFSHLATFTREHCLSARRGLLHHLKSYSLLLKISEENQDHASRGHR